MSDKNILQEYKHALFRGRSELCKRVVYVLLKSCNSKISQIRQNSAATLYYLMHTENYEMGSHKKGFARSQLQVRNDHNLGTRNGFDKFENFSKKMNYTSCRA